MLLPLDEQRVEHGAAVVDGDVADEADLACLGVDLDHRDVGAERERRSALVEVDVGAERAERRLVALRRLRGQLVPPHRRGGHAGDPDRARVRRR